MNKPILFCLNTSVFSDRQLYEKAYMMVPEERKKKVDGFIFDKDKFLSLGAGMLIKYAFSSLGIDNYSERIVYNKYGKPLLKDDSIYFNISHSGQWVICALSDEVIACDIEKVVPIELALAKLLEDSEYDDIMAKDDSLREDWIYRYWVLKESFMKAVGLGVNLELKQFRITVKDKITVKHNVDQKEYHFRELDDFEGYKCAVCSSGNLDELSIKTLDLREEFFMNNIIVKI